MKFKNIFLYLLFFTNFHFIEARTEDLSDDYKSQRECTYANAAYMNVSDKGEVNRYCIDNQSNVYQILGKQKPNWTGVTISGLGPIRIGNLKKSEVTQGNSCYLGTNVQCLSNIVTTTTQYKIDGNYLMKYWRSDMNGSKGRVNSATLAIHREGKDDLLKQAIKFNNQGIDAIAEKKYDQAVRFAYRGVKWYPNIVGAFLIAYSQDQLGYYQKAFNNINDVINNMSSVEWGLDYQWVETDQFYWLRGKTQYQLGMQKENYCWDIKKAIELSTESEDIQTYKDGYKTAKCS